MSPASDQRPAQNVAPQSGTFRQNLDRTFVVFCIATASVSVAILIVLLTAIFVQGIPSLSWNFLTSPPSPDTTEAGISPALYGTIWVCSACALFTLPIGVGTAILLEEFKPSSRATRVMHGFVQLNITNLAGVPSVVYGIIGLTAFVSMFGMLGSTSDPVFEMGVRYYDQFLSEGDRALLVPVSGRNAPETVVADGLTALLGDQRFKVNVLSENAPLPTDARLQAVTLRSDAEAGRISRKAWYYLQLPFGRGVLAGALTLMLVVLPIVIVSTQEALRGVPDSLREAASGLGATRWQVVWNVTLPASIPGIMTGAILATSRAIGEAAPVLIIAGIVYIASAPGHLMDDYSVMPLQIYNWAQRPQKDFHALAASGIIVLLVILLSFNAVAVFVRQRLQRASS
ncbi:MAG: phosphate ABC transporter permease PstA [Planctomycetaceae bacterium]|nr:phosphate ABC transporter permease PstA [Planctomycetales bacterium]MCB9874675.1 phosphate ABC transporter permease PstA [Planctomycetaceae bacterium]MCB9938404.1 phosphate ABC transporter permease PstA [Planctomycetaceae bacterium]